ncbi:hypothetical protein VTJ04DRAFT_4102 [Mycothermus thermophilus]|uniref:uncharacterized protein n=1 Tax=Humicola insolens TaxID=85995 RepID=UPI003744912F
MADTPPTKTSGRADLEAFVRACPPGHHEILDPVVQRTGAQTIALLQDRDKLRTSKAGTLDGSLVNDHRKLLASRRSRDDRTCDGNRKSYGTLAAQAAELDQIVVVVGKSERLGGRPRR